MAIYTDMQESYYRHELEGLNASSIKDFIKSRHYYYLKHIAKTIKQETTPAMQFGSLLHLMTLEPHLFEQTYAIKPDGLSLVTKEGKQWKADNENKIIISQEDYDLANRLSCSAIDCLHNFGFSVFPQEKEIVLTGVTEQFIPTKGKIDLIAFGDHIYNIDLKTCQGLDDKSIANTVFNFGYDIAMCFYDELIYQNYGKRPKSMLLMLDKTTEDVRLVDITHWVNETRPFLDRKLKEYAEVMNHDLWHMNYDLTEITPLSWHRRI